MTGSDEKLASSLTAESTDLIPFLPYLLQDLWEFGSSPADMISLLKKNTGISENFTVLDLGCGKGAVSVSICKAFGCRTKGIDLIPEFIKEADNKAVEHAVADLTYFTTGDITDSVVKEKNYDLVIYGALGDVLGEPAESITLLKQTLKPGGYILIDDVYAQANSSEYHTKEEWQSFFEKARIELIDEKVIEKERLIDLCQHQIKKITQRASELKVKHPQQSELFDSYIESQQAECSDLENNIDGVTLLLKSI